MAQEAGRELFLALVQKQDVLIETFQPSYLERVGLGFDILRQKNPRLIQLSLTGFGQTGPRRNYRSCDSVSSAFGGQMYVSGVPSGPPVRLYGDQSSYAASLSGAVAVLLAIRRRRLTGTGTYIDLSIQEAVVSTLDHVMVRYFHDGIISRRQGGHYWNHVFHIFPCRDGHIQMTILYRWETLLEWMASEGMAGDLIDAVWREEAYRVEHIEHIVQIMERWTAMHGTQELFELGQAMQFPWAPVSSPPDVLASPQLGARQFFNRDESRGGAAIPSRPGLPYRFSGWRQRPAIPVSLPGEHNRQIYEEELGLTDGDVDGLVTAKVI